MQNRLQMKWNVALKKKAPLVLMMLPGLIYLAINNYMPMFGIILAFKNYNYKDGFLNSAWCGLKNFEFLFKTKASFTMIRNTLCYNFVFVILGVVIPIMVAIAMHEIGKKRLAKFAQPAVIFPFVISWVIVGYIVYAFLNSSNGFVNNSILKENGISWYSEPQYWPVIIVIVYIWKTAGFNSIVYMASIAGIDENIYEAARVDGAGKLSQIKNITIPLLKPTIITLTLMSISKIFNSDFGLFYQVPMNSGQLYPTTQTIDTYVYNALMEINDVGMASAATFFQSIAGFILILAANLIVSKIDRDNALF